jgi:hypothetical protein
MHALIRHELVHVATNSPWAVQLSDSYDTTSNVGGHLESDLAVLTKTLNQEYSDYVGGISG